MDIAKIVATALISIVLIAILKPIKKEYAIVLSIASGILIFSFIFSYLKSIVQTINNIMERFNIDNSMIIIIMKIIAIAYICEFGSSICKDAGETAISTKVELGGKIIIVYLALPIISSVIELLASFL